MRAGALDDVVQIQAATAAQDSTGDVVETWSTVLTLPAQRMSGSKVSEKFGADQRFSTLTDVFKVRYWPGYMVSVNNHRLLHENRTYNIIGIFELGRRDGLQLLCSARNEGGLPV